MYKHSVNHLWHVNIFCCVWLASLHIHYYLYDCTHNGDEPPKDCTSLLSGVSEDSFFQLTVHTVNDVHWKSLHWHFTVWCCSVNWLLTDRYRLERRAGNLGPNKCGGVAEGHWSTQSGIHPVAWQGSFKGQARGKQQIEALTADCQ